MNRSNALTLTIVAAGLTGCAHIGANTPFEYTPSLPTGQTIDLTVGMEVVTDERPDKDIKATKALSDVNEKMTSKMLEDLRTSNTFTQVNFPPTPEDDLLLRSTVTRFSWKAQTNPVLFIPLVNFSLYFGVPAGTMEGVAALKVDVLDSNGTLLKTYTKEASFKDSYTIYNMRAEATGVELADAFRDIMKQLKGDLAADRATFTGK